MKKTLYIAFKMSIMAIFALIAASCEKVIKVDLNSSNPALTIEALINDTINAGAVRITKTTDFYSPSVPESVSGAIVQITDSQGKSITLNETLLPINGTNTMVYITQDIKPKHNETYKLTVSVEGKTYASESTLLTPIAIDSIKFLKSDRPQSGGKFKLIPHCYFKDPKGIANFYRLKIKLLGNTSTTNDTEDRYYLRDDKFFDGNENDFAFNGFDLASGSKIQVELISLDSKAYDYFRTLANIVSSGGGMSSSSPANPNSNISNNALGYFAAEAISVKVVTVP